MAEIDREALLKAAGLDGMMAATNDEVRSFYKAEGELSDFSKFVLQVKEDIDTFCMGLKGYYFDGKNWVTPEVTPGPQANDRCIEFIRTTLNANLNRNTFLSNFDKPRILLKLRQGGINILQNFMINWKEYEFDTDKFDPYTLAEDVISFIEAGLFRPLDQGERNFIKNTKKILEHIFQGNQPKKGFSLLGRGN